MKSVEEVRALLDAAARPLTPSPLPLADCQGLILAKELRASADQPPFDRSSIDGFAVLAGSTPGKFHITGSIAPGEPAPSAPQQGCALRIATGAAVPEGCALAMVEDTREENGLLEILSPPSPTLIRKKGSSIRAGDILVPAGTEIHAGEIALLASEGCATAPVHPRPRILHITTGSEIIPLAQAPRPGEIRNTNAPMLRALISSSGAIPLPGTHVDESLASLAAAIGASEPFDILLVSGGASVGRHDNTRATLESLGFEILAHGVNLKPGKPLILARRGATLAFGIPGNPASHFAVFHLFIRRAIDLLMGKNPTQLVPSTLEPGTDIAAERRETFLPARCRNANGSLLAAVLPWVDSGDIACLRGANALLRIPENSPPPQPGSRVEVLPCTAREAPFFSQP
jgi:molybdopterin molybdotransferase